MRLSLKLSLFTALGILVVLAGDGYLRVQREHKRLMDELRRDHYSLAHALKLAAEASADRAGPQRALQLLKDVDRRESGLEIRWAADPLRALKKTTSAVTQDAATRRRYLVTRIPLQLGQPGQLVLSQSLSTTDKYTSATVVGALQLSVLLIVLSTAIIFAVGWWLLGTPLRMLVASARQIGSGDFSTRVFLRRRDEMGMLARELNLMCERLSETREHAIEESASKQLALERLGQADRWTTLGKLAVGMADSLDAAVQDIKTRASTLRDAPLESTYQAHALAIEARAEQLAKLSRRVRDYAAPAELVSEQDLARIARDAVGLLEQTAEHQGVRVEVESDPETVAICAQATRLQQLTIHLVLNALEASPAGGVVRVGAHRNCRPYLSDGLKIGPSSYVCLVVEDEGAGMSAEVRERMFEPLYTTREGGKRSGLGLAAVSEIVQEHRGFIGVDTAPSAGTRITVFLPVQARRLAEQTLAP